MGGIDKQILSKSGRSTFDLIQWHIIRKIISSSLQNLYLAPFLSN